MKELPAIPITDLIDAFGTKTKIGEAIGVTHSAICHWGDFVPATRLARSSVTTLLLYKTLETLF